MEIMLKNVRIAFIDTLVKADDYKTNGVGNGVFRHSATFIYAPGSEADKSVQAAILQEATNVWGKNAQSMLDDLKGNVQKYCVQKNKKDSKGEIYDGFEGQLSIGAHRQKKDGAPLLLHKNRDPATGKAQVLTGEEGVIYAGCYVNAKISIYAQSGKNSGIRAGLLAVQYAGEGDSFGGAGRAKADEFDSIDADDDLA